MADPNSYANLYVTHVFELSKCAKKPEYSNILFWGRLDREAGVAMDEQLSRASRVISEKPPPLLNDLRKVKMFLTPLNGEWARARVKDLAVDSYGQIEIFCMDHGITQSQPLKMLRLIPSDLESLQGCPPLASMYCLADVVVSKDPDLRDKTEEYLKTTIQHKVVKSVMVGTYEGFAGARIFFKDQLVAKDLHDLKLVEPALSYGEAIKMPIPTIELPLKSNSIIKPNNLSSKNSSAPVGVARPLLNNLSPPPTQIKNSPVKQVHTTSNYYAPFLEKDVVHCVSVTHVQNGPLRFTVRPNSTETAFGMADIQQRIAELEKHLLKPFINPARGAPCLAFSSIDNALHRALVNSSEDVQTYNVYFVDHGRFELVSQSKLYQIPGELIAHKLMAIRVYLSEAEELSKFNGIAEKFAKMTLNKSFHCRVVDDSMPQGILMFDDAGRNLKDVLVASFTQPHFIVDATTPSIFLSAPQKQQLPQSSRSGYMRMDLKIEPPEVDSIEKLFVTFVGPPGKFFGQFEKKTMEDLKAINDELKKIYGSQGSDLPLLYSDVRSHIGDFAIIRYTDDLFYRVKVLKEYVNDVEVSFVDYGDVIRVFRHEIWAPVKALKLFTQQPFGVNCIVSGVTASADDWQNLLIDQSVSVNIGPGVEAVFSILFSDDELNMKLMDANKAGKAKMLEMPKIVSPVPTAQDSNNKPLPMHTNGKLVLDVSDENENGHGKKSGPSSVRSFGSVMDFLAPPRSQVAPYSNASSTSRNGLETFELKRSPRRHLPIAEPVPLFYPEPKNLEGKTKTVQVAHVDDTGSFYCHVIDDLPQLEKMVEKLNDAYSDESKPCMHFGRIGQACVARYTDDGWYRGKIIEIDGSEVNILFIDYGNQQRGPLTSLKIIDEEFVKLPPQAYPCALRMVPINDEKAKFESIVMEKTLQASFYRIGLDKKYQTKLFYEESGIKFVINEQFGGPAVDSVPVPTESFTSLSRDLVRLEVNVAWFYKPSRFFLTPSDLTAYQAHLDELDDFYSSLAFGELAEDSPRNDLPCVVRFTEDQRYYRAKILSVKDQIANVLFVDYGNEQTTPLKELKRIASKFMKIPQLTWECRLRDVRLLPLTPNTPAHLAACFMTDKKLSATIYPADSDGVFPVDLSVPEIGDVHEYLIKNKVIERVGADYQIPPQCLEFAPGRVIFTEAVVPFSTSILEFWVQPDHKKVDELMERLDSLAQKPEFVCNRSFTPLVGKSCLACFSDQRWYRGIIEKLEGDSASVYYVDYGNSSIVSTRDLRGLPVEYAQQPAMAYKCRLDGVDTASQEINDKFSELVLPIFVDVHFVKKVDQVLQVRLLTKDGVDVAESIRVVTKEALPSEADAYVSYAKSPSQFWVQLKSNEEQLTKIENELHGRYDSNTDGVVNKPIIGETYGVHHPEYTSWYRAQVLAVSGSSAEVQFIDYGDTRAVPINNIRQLPGSLGSIPHLAIECCLKGELQEDEFTRITSSSDTAKVKFCGKNANVQMVEFVGTEKEIPSIEPLGIEKQTVMAVGNIDQDDSWGLGCQATSKDPVVQINLRTSDDVNYVPGRVLATTAQAVVITSAWDVWIQFDPAAADDFSDKLAQYINTEEFARIPVARPILGENYLAQFPEDGLWYRAKVVEICDSQVKVIYYDYGNGCFIDANKLKPLPAAMNELPPFARKFALDGVDNLRHPDAAQCQGELFGKELSVTFTKKTDEHLFVRVHDKDGVDLNQQLGLETLVDQSVLAQNVSHVVPVPIPAHAVEVTVSHIKSNNTFWIQRKSDENLLREIELVATSFEKQWNEAQPTAIPEGELCIVRHPARQRYVRGKINVLFDDNASIYLLDFGETLTIPKSKLRRCPDLLRFIPPVAIECTFRTPIYPDQFSVELQRAFAEATDGCVCHALFDGSSGGSRVQTLETLYANGVDVLTMLSGRLVSSTPQSGKAINDNNFPMFGNGYRRGL